MILPKKCKILPKKCIKHIDNTDFWYKILSEIPRKRINSRRKNMAHEILNILWKYKLNIGEFVNDFVYNEYFKTWKGGY